MWLIFAFPGLIERFWRFILWVWYCVD